MEALASFDQAAKRKARSYRTYDTCVLMAYRIARKLDLKSTHTKCRRTSSVNPSAPDVKC
jgi:hypothetical protein